MESACNEALRCSWNIRKLAADRAVQIVHATQASRPKVAVAR